MIYVYHINYVKYKNNILAQFFCYLLFCMKPDTIYLVNFGCHSLYPILAIYLAGNILLNYM